MRRLYEEMMFQAKGDAAFTEVPEEKEHYLQEAAHCQEKIDKL